MKTVAIYARCSTTHQNIENQLQALRQHCRQFGFKIYKEYVDNGVSGARSRNERQALKTLLKEASKGKFEKVICFSICRLGRSLSDLVEILAQLESLKIDLYFQQQSMDTSTATGKMMFQIAGAFAEFERTLIKERVIAGQKRAKSEGKHIGRPSAINESMKHAVRLLREKGEGIRAISRALNCGIGTVYACL
jgi:DNA invertase Pin-like site-specific DNA recombinase